MKIRPLLIVLTSNIFTQAISMLTYAFIGIRGGPQSLGLFATFISLSGIMGTLISLRMDQAILGSRSEKEATQLAISGMYISVTLAFLIFTGISLLSIGNLTGLGATGLTAKAVKLTPLYSAGVAVISISESWTTASKNIKRLAISKALGSFSFLIATVYVLVIYKEISGGSLIACSFVPIAIQAVTLVRPLVVNTRRDILVLTSARLAETIRSAEKYMRYGVLVGLINTISIDSPQILVASLYGPENAGVFALSSKVMGSLTPLITSSVAKMYYIKCRESAERGVADFRDRTTSLINRLSVAVIPTLGYIAIGAVAIALNQPGGRWDGSSIYMICMAAPYSLWSISQPLGCWYLLLNRQEEQLKWNIIHLVGKVLSLIVAWVALKEAAIAGVGLLCAVSSLLYMQKICKITGWLQVTILDSGWFILSSAIGIVAFALCALASLTGKWTGTGYTILVATAIGLGCYHVWGMRKLQIVSTLVDLPIKA